MARWRTICCAVDFSDASRAALEEALLLAERLGARVTLVHVIERRVGPEPLFAPPARRDRGREADELAEWVREAECRLPGGVSSVLLSGDAGVEIARLAREFQFDLVVVGASGRKGMARLVLGSVADDVMHGVQCPVLCVRPAAAVEPQARTL